MADFVRFDAANQSEQSVWINPENVVAVAHAAPGSGQTVIFGISASQVVEGEPKDVVRDLRDRRGDDN